MQQTRWAMVGTGLMLDLIGRDLVATENVDARVLVSRSQERADALAKEFGFGEGASDLDAVLQRDDIDVVYIGTPHTEHFPMAMAALEAGKHVLVEKPMTTSAAHTRELCAAAEAKGLFLMEAMWTAFNPNIREMRHRVQAGEIGDITLAKADFSFAAPYRPDWRLWAKELAGGSTLDQAVYTLSLAHFMFGAPDRITVRGTIQHEVDAEVVAILEYVGGQRAVCTSGLRALAPNRFFIAGTTGYLETLDECWKPTGFIHGTAPADASTYHRDEVRLPIEGEGYVPMVRAVSAAILAGRTQLEERTHAESIALAEVMDEVLRQVHAQG